jgi:hypothetical protein
MDPAKLARVAERLSASLGVAWAAGVLAASRGHLRPFQSAMVVLLAALALHPPRALPPGFRRQFLATTQRLVLTVYAQHVFAAAPPAADGNGGALVESVAAACALLLAADLVCARAGPEGVIFLNSVKFMFAASLRGAIAGARRRAGPVLTACALALAYAACRALAPRPALADGVSMVVFDEAAAALDFAALPYVGEFVACLLAALAPPDAGGVVSQLQEYSRLSASDAVARLAGALPYAPSLTVFVAAQLALQLPDAPFSHAARDVSALALFQAVLRDSTALLHSSLPSDSLFAFGVTLVLFTGLQHLTATAAAAAKKEAATPADAAAAAVAATGTTSGSDAGPGRVEPQHARAARDEPAGPEAAADLERQLPRGGGGGAGTAAAAAAAAAARGR